FALGAALPLITAYLTPPAQVGTSVAVATLATLLALGALAARVGGASPVRGALRVAGWGAVAMAVTAAVGALVGVAV
ncbi:MAG TPA: VIT1/CCC1 transporter family protein, partial [Rubricoccaceae bacterium]